jgi:DNA-binding NtrC family response regulator
MQEILLTFVGNRDPFPVESQETSDVEAGPVLSLLRAREFHRVVLLCTGSSYIERGRMVEEAAKAEGVSARFNFVSIELDSPIDYQEILRELMNAIEVLRPSFDYASHRLSVLLDPGTPQMQTAWFLIVASGGLDAQLLQGVPARFAGGAYKVRQVGVGPEHFPEIEISMARTSNEEREKRAPKVDDAGGDARWIRSWRTQIVGSSVVFQDALDQATRIARYGISVMIRGETGTGKELIARLIHEESERSNAAFVAVNCAAVSPSLAESELFGHEKGAFTGDDRARLGQFRAADGGTVLLDEVGDLPMEAQAKLLRVLENRTVTPVGSDSEVHVDVRILAATNRDLEQRIADGEFRRDLYERLAQVTIQIPPLRERPEDLSILLRHFIDRWNRQYGESKGLSDEAIRYLLDYPWPGNVRELQNTVAAMCAMGQSRQIGPELLPPAITRHFARKPADAPLPTDLPSEGLDLRAVLHNVEKGYYEQALHRTEGNAEQAARLLGLQGPAFRKAARERLGVEWKDRAEE